MTTLRRMRTIILVSGTTLSLLIVALFVASAFQQVAIDLPGGMFAAASGGTLMLGDDVFDVVWFTELSGPSLADWNQWGWSTYIQVPIYAVLAIVAVPTLLVWRFGPKPVKPGHCECGFDLTGNESGYCPECGRPGGRLVIPSEGLVTRIQRIGRKRE